MLVVLLQMSQYFGLQKKRIHKLCMLEAVDIKVGIQSVAAVGAVGVAAFKREPTSSGLKRGVTEEAILLARMGRCQDAWCATLSSTGLATALIHMNVLIQMNAKILRTETMTKAKLFIYHYF